MHSIRSQVPRLFDGRLPDLNMGTNHGRSCGQALQARIEQFAQRIEDRTSYRCAVNGRFVGGHITRKYGQPERQVHAVQLEISQATYLDESQCGMSEVQWDPHRAAELQPVLREWLELLT